MKNFKNISKNLYFFKKMESKEIKELRKKKYLEKMKKQNIQNKEYKENKYNNENKNNNIQLINDLTPIYQSNSSLKKNNQEFNEGETITNINNNIIKNNDDNNNIENNIRNNEINKNNNVDYDLLNKKINKFEYYRNLLNFIKKICIIILSLLHCFSMYNFDDKKMFKNTLFIIEITALFIDIILNNIIKRKVKNTFNTYNDDNSNEDSKDNDLPINNYFKLLDKYTVNLTFLDYIFRVYNYILDFIYDIAIFFTVNFIFFIFHEEDE